jgi:hypothetical protein
MDIDNLLDIYNGTAFIEAGTQEWGYVDKQWYLQVPLTLKIADQYKPIEGETAFSDKTSKNDFIKLNYYALAAPNALGNSDKALFGALLRYHMVDNGMYAPDVKTRCVSEDEYTYVRGEFRQERIEEKLIDIPLYSQKEYEIPLNPNSESIAEFVKKYADTLIQIMVFVFSSKGHHWQNEYDVLYDRLMRLAFVERPINWVMPTNREIFRQIMHCFGIYRPLLFSIFCKENSRMVAPMMLRFSPHAPVAGAAVIHTSLAIYDRMRQETWWSLYYERFKLHVDTIATEYDKVRKDPYDYHVASKVLIGKNRIMASPEFTNSFNRVSQHLLGYVNYLGKRNNLSGEKSVTSRAGGISPSGETFSDACTKLGKVSFENLNMAGFLDII